MKPRIFGIDLGTTKSAIGLVQEGRPVLLPIDGDELMPSVVCFPVGAEPLVGRPALNQLRLQPERTIRSAKRLLGSAHTWDLGDRTVTPVEFSAILLRHLASAAEAATGERPQAVVITVPAWFTQAQRSDTRAAGELAGLEVVRLVNEPTAAALAHAQGQDVRRNVLVYDFGGGTFDVSLVVQDGPVIEVKASHGDTWLGGDDVDDALVAQVLQRLSERDPQLARAIEASEPARMRLRADVEEVKIRLSEHPTAVLRTPFLVTVDGSPRHVELAIAREDLEELVLPLFQRTLVSVDRVLADAGMKPSEIDDLLLVGGSTQLPLIWSGLKKRYGLEGDQRVPPRRAVALGAAVQAALIEGRGVTGVLVDVAPYALSVGMATGGIPGFPTHFVCEVITPRNAPLPAHHTYLVRTAHPTQTRVRLPVYQGSDPDPRNNVILGEIAMHDLPPATINELYRPIAVEILHDLDGRVRIVITDQLSGRTVQGTVASDGAEQTALRETWEAYAQEQDLAFGDPYLKLQAHRPASGSARLPEAEALWEAIEVALPTLRVEHPDEVDALLQAVRQGREALDRGDLAAARGELEALQDRLFEAGIYL